jgi:hypothetical protein
MTKDEYKAQYPGFTVTCDNCKSTRVVLKNSLGYSEANGPSGSIDLACDDCAHWFSWSGEQCWVRPC